MGSRHQCTCLVSQPNSPSRDIPKDKRTKWASYARRGSIFAESHRHDSSGQSALRPIHGRYHVASNLSGKSLEDLDLSTLDFKRANLSRANLFGAKLVGADFSGANRSGAKLVSRTTASSSRLSANAT